MRLPVAIDSSLRQPTYSGDHADRVVYRLSAEGGPMIPGLFRRIHRRNSAVLRPITKDGILGLREVLYHGEACYKVSEFVRCHHLDEMLKKAGYSTDHHKGDSC